MQVSRAAFAQQPAVAVGAALAVPVVPLRVPLVVDGRQRAEIDVLLEPGTGRVRAAADTLMRELAALLAEGPEQDLSRNADAAGMVSLEDLRLLGLRASFDEEALKLHVDVPAALRAVVDLPMRALLPAGATGEPVAPARTSAFLNLRGGLTSLEGAQNATSGAVAADGAFNFEGWAVEARGAWLQGNSPPFLRTATRLVRDVPERSLRLTAGDLAYSVRGLQSFIPLGGIAAAKDFGLQPYRQVRAAGATTFFLDTPATVEFFVNDRLVRSAGLPAGPYAAHSFPFLSGVNDVRISIVDAFGTRRVMDFSVGFDATLLKAGETEWSYAAGFPATPRAGDIEYDLRSPVASLFTVGA